MFEDTTVLIISRKSTDNKMFKRKRTSVLRYTDSDYPFGIFKLLLNPVFSGV
jgi:hypothetical protein